MSPVGGKDANQHDTSDGEIQMSTCGLQDHISLISAEENSWTTMKRRIAEAIALI